MFEWFLGHKDPRTGEGVPGPKTTVVAPSDKPRPCCVCQDDKAKRDECVLNARDGQDDIKCQDIIKQYKVCMKGYGFEI